MAEQSLPPLECDNAIDLIDELYGLKVLGCSPLRSYADRNFLVTVEGGEGGCNGNDVRRVLKVLNKRQSKSHKYINAQNEYLLHLRNNGINCPKLFQTIEGHLSTSRRLPENTENGDNYNIRLFSYIPGTDMYDMESRPSSGLLQEVGQLLANVCNVEEVFDHEGYEENGSMFVPERLPTLTGYTSYIPDEHDKQLVADVIRDYTETVVPELDKIKPHPIHGDISPSNLVITRHQEDSALHVEGIIDIFDTMKSRIIFEIAICLGLMLQRFGGTEDDNMRIISDILTGFVAVRKLSKVDRDLLKICTEACLARLVVCGAYFVATGDCDPEEVKRSTDCFCLRKLRQISSDNFSDMLMKLPNASE